jgi:hypothetical protein
MKTIHHVRLTLQQYIRWESRQQRQTISFHMRRLFTEMCASTEGWFLEKKTLDGNNHLQYVTQFR